jgi:hypothetical protein
LVVAGQDGVDMRLVYQLALARGSHVKPAADEVWLEDGSGSLIPIVLLRVAGLQVKNGRVIGSLTEAVLEAIRARPARSDAVALLHFERPFAVRAVPGALRIALAEAFEEARCAYREVWVDDAFGDAPIEIRLARRL